MSNRRIIAAVLVVGVVAVVAGCDSDAAERADEDHRVAPEPVETLVVSPKEFTDTFEVVGTAEPEEAVEVATEFPGEVLDAYVQEGDRVSRGDPLFRIDTETDEAGQDVLRTRVDAAERELERTNRLYEEGLATEQQLDNARTELETAQKDLRQSEVSIGRHRVRSPVDGEVAVRMFDPGEFAGSGMPLAEVIDYRTIVVYAQVPESEIRHVDLEEEATLQVEIPALETTHNAEIDRVSLRPSPNTRTYTAEVHIDNEERSIRPGMRARAHFERDHYPEALVVPRDAILEGYDGREVMVLEGDDEVGEAKVRTVETGPGTRDEVVVLSGLDSGDRLILRGHRGLVADARVEAVEEAHQGGGEGEP